jgi:hypothetical protein
MEKRLRWLDQEMQDREWLGLNLEMTQGLHLRQARGFKFYVKSNDSPSLIIFFKWRNWPNEGKYFLVPNS